MSGLEVAEKFMRGGGGVGVGWGWFQVATMSNLNQSLLELL